MQSNRVAAALNVATSKNVDVSSARYAITNEFMREDTRVMGYEALRDIEILFGLALITVVLFRKLMFPSIIGFLATGVLAGPHSLGLIKNTHQVEQMAEIGVVLLLFTIGIEFSLKELMRIKHMVLLGGGFQVFFTILVISAMGIIFNFPLSQSIFFGFLVALSSTAILIKLLADAGELDTPHGKTALGILIFQDLCIVPLMLFTPLLGGGGDGWQQILIFPPRLSLFFSLPITAPDLWCHGYLPRSSRPEAGNSSS